MKNIINKLIPLAILGFTPLIFAQQVQQVPQQVNAGINPGGGPGPVGPGVPSSPIDMYMYILAIIAIAFIYIYAKKTSKKVI